MAIQRIDSCSWVRADLSLNVTCEVLKKLETQKCLITSFHFPYVFHMFSILFSSFSRVMLRGLPPPGERHPATMKRCNAMATRWQRRAGPCRPRDPPSPPSRWRGKGPTLETNATDLS